jgi:hypothetical protein
MQDAVSTEHMRRGFGLEGEREAYLHRMAFQMLADSSLDPAASRERILETAQAHWPAPGANVQMTQVVYPSSLRRWPSGLAVPRLPGCEEA